MADSIKIDLKGFAELAEQLKDFGPKVARNGLRTSTFAGAKVIKDEIAAKAPVRTGALRDSISTFKRHTDSDNVVQYSIGIRNIRQKYGNTSENLRKRRVGKTYFVQGPTFYGRFVEFGTSKMSAHPFMRPGFASAVQGALNAIRDGLAKAVDRATKRGG